MDKNVSSAITVINSNSPVNIVNISWKSLNRNRREKRTLERQEKHATVSLAQVTTNKTTNGNILHLNDNSIIDTGTQMIAKQSLTFNNRRNSELNFLIFNKTNETASPSQVAISSSMSNSSSSALHSSNRASRLSSLIAKTQSKQNSLNSLQNLPLISQKMRQRKYLSRTSIRPFINENSSEVNVIGGLMNGPIMQEPVANSSLKSLGTMMNAAQSLMSAATPSALYEFLWDERIKAHLESYSSLRTDNKILYGYETIDNYTKYWYISENGNYFGGLI